MSVVKKLPALFLVVLTLTACTKDPYRAAIQGSDDVSQGVAATIKIAAAYYNAKTINDGQKAAVANYLNAVTDCNTKFRGAVVVAHQQGTAGASVFLPIADSFVQCAQTQHAVMSDPKVFNVLKAVDTAINGVETAIASAKGAS